MAIPGVSSTTGRLGRAIALGVWLCLPAASHGATSVSGAIASSTQWRAQDGPFEVVGDLYVTNGATLTIEAGVTVYMRESTNLVVEQGALRALGNADQPVTITSYRDRLGDTPAPGDWGQLRFRDGTVDANTLLQNARIRYGQGVVCEQAGATLNNVVIADHAGAAISADLACSLAGSGNTAQGNTLNAVAIPAGDITGNVKWGLRGIPYFVASGVVSVGASPTIGSITPNSIQQGDTVTMVVGGTGLAGLADARFDNPGLTVQLLPGSTATQANLSVSAAVSATTGPTRLRLLVDAGEASLPNGVSVTRLQPTLSAVTPSPVYLGQGTVSVLLTGRNFTAQSQAEVNGALVGTEYQSATQLRATVAVPASAGTLTIRLRTPDPLAPGQDLLSNPLLLPVVAAQLALTPASASVAKGFLKTFSVTLPYAAPAGGLNIDLVSSVPTVASVPSTLTLPAGQSSADFQLNAIGLGTTAVTASKPGFISSQAQVTVVPPPTLTLTPGAITLGVGRSADVIVQSNAPAGPAGIAVVLSISDGAVASIPTQVAIPAGANAATFTLVAKAIGTAVLQAQAPDFVSAGTAVTVRAVSLALPAGTLVAPGLTRSIPITLSDPAPAGDLVIALNSGNPALASVPTSITVPAGALAANFTLTGVAAGTSTVNANAPGYQSASLPVTVEAVSVHLGAPAISSLSLPAGLTRSFAVTLSRPAPTGGVLVELTTADSAKVTVAPASVFIAEGQTSGNLVLAAVTAVAEGTTTLFASAAGLSAASIPVTVTKKAELVFNRAAATVGKGLKTYVAELSVSRRTGTASYAPSDPLTVSLTSSDPTRASVPATVTIPANNDQVNFYVTGVDLTAGTPVTIDASAAGYSAPLVKLPTTVINPVLSFNGLDTQRSPASSRDDVRISVSTPGSPFSSNQTAAADLPIDLVTVQATPADIIDGFYGALTGGTPGTQVVLRRDSTISDFVYVGTPTAAGSYRVQASTASGSSATSAVVTVSPPELKFSRTSIIVGKGLKTYVAEVAIQRAVNGQSFSGAQALTVSLTSSDPTRASVPATVTIPANNDQVNFYVTGVDLTAGTPVTIDASAAGYSAPLVKLPTTVINPVLSFNGLDTQRSPASSRDDVRISVSTPGSPFSSNQTAAADLPIDLVTVQATPADIIDGFYGALTGGTPGTQVVLRRDSTISDFVYVGTPTAAGSYRVQASTASGSSATSAVVTVSPPELKFSRTSIIVGKGLKTYVAEVAIQRAVNGQSFSGAQALTVSLTSSDPTRASVPATVTIPANNDQVNFYVTGVDLTAGTPVTIDASAAGYSAPLVKLPTTVINPVLSFNGLDTQRSPASSRDDVRISVSTPGSPFSSNQTAAADLPIDLATVQATPADIVDGFYAALTGGTPGTQVVLRRDNNFSDFVYVGTPTAAGSYRVQASTASGSSATSAVVTVSPPELKFSTTSVTVGKGLKTYVAELSIQRSVNGQSFNGTQAVTVSLACSSTSICKVAPTVTIPAGQASASVIVEGVALGNTTISASAVGYTAAQDVAVNVVTPQLNFSGLTSQLGAGTQSSFRVYVSTPGSPFSNNQTAAQPIAVSLTSSAPGVATLPASVTIQTGDTISAFVNLSGVAAGTTTVTASNPGMATATSGLVTVTP